MIHLDINLLIRIISNNKNKDYTETRLTNNKKKTKKITK